MQCLDSPVSLVCSMKQLATSDKTTNSVVKEGSINASGNSKTWYV